MPDDYAYDPAWDYGYQTTPAVSYDYAPAADYGMGVQTRPNIIHELVPYTEPVRNIPTADYGGLLPVSSEPAYQSLPADTSTMVPAADYGMASPTGALSYAAAGAPVTTSPNMSEADFLASLTGQPAAAAPTSATDRSDYYTALRDYVAGLSSPYGMYIPEVSQLLRSTAGSPTGRLGSGAYDVMASNPWAALTMDQNAPIDPSLLAAITSSVNPNAPYEQNVTYQFNPFKEGKYASSNAIDVLYNTPIRLTDARGNTIMSGVGFQAAEQIAKAVQDAYGSGAKSEFRIDTGMPGDTSGKSFKTASITSPDVNGLALFGKLALSAIGGQMLGPLIGGPLATAAPAGAVGATAGMVPTALGAGVGAALGSATGGALAGDSLGDILKSAALAGLSTFGVSKLLGSLGVQGAQKDALLSAFDKEFAPTIASMGGLESIGADIAANAAPIASNVSGPIVVTGAPGAAAGGGLSAAAGITPFVASIGQQVAAQAAQEAAQKQQPDQAAQQTEQPGTVVYASNAPVPGPVTLPIPITSVTTPSGLDAVDANDIVVKAAPVNKNVVSVPVNGLISTSGNDVPTSVNTDEIVVKGNAKTDPNAAVVLPTNALTGNPIGAEDGKLTLSKIADYLQLAGLGVGLLGNLGGGGSGALGKMPGGFGSGSGIYSAKLPTPGQGGAFAVGGLGGGTAPGIGGIVPPGGDYTKFGMGNAPVAAAADIPQYGGVNPPGFNTNTWEWLGPQTGNVPMLDTSQLPVKKLAMGGYAVGGPGDGRSDEIPAMLSDGEYVMDAETVALLGNGSNKAGAKQLDKFRANIRKHKGRELARGDFSAKAKKPEAYLSGGRS